MRGSQQLLESENNWVTDMGAYFPGQGRVIFRGCNLFDDLQDLSWMSLLLFAITGRIPNPTQSQLFEGIWRLCTSYPDPRIWNNRVAALAGTTRSTAALAISAANAVSEAEIYGGRPEIRAMDFLCRVQRKLSAGTDLLDIIHTEFKKHRVLPGYGRPITWIDERIEPLTKFAEQLGISDGVYQTLAFRIETLLIEEGYRIRMNVAALAAAITADQGLSPQEFYRVLVLCFSAGAFACHVDAAEKPEGTLFPLRCSRIDYRGAAPRDWA
jgi:hypothetical protein